MGARRGHPPARGSPQDGPRDPPAKKQQQQQQLRPPAATPPADADEEPAAAVPVAGFVFTGGGQPFCPPGLLIGRAEPVIGGDLLRITTPRRSGSQQVEVVQESR